MPRLNSVSSWADQEIPQYRRRINKKITRVKIGISWSTITNVKSVFWTETFSKQSISLIELPDLHQLIDIGWSADITSHDRDQASPPPIILFGWPLISTSCWIYLLQNPRPPLILWRHHLNWWVLFCPDAYYTAERSPSWTNLISRRELFFLMLWCTWQSHPLFLLMLSLSSTSSKTH